MIQRIYIPIILSDLDDFVEDINELRPSDEQITLSDDFLDEIFSEVQNSILDDVQFTDNPVLEAVNTLIHNTIQELASTNKYVSKASTPNKPEEVTKLNLQQFINTYKPLSANKYPLEEEITREDKILFYYTVGTKRESTALLDQPNSKTESYLWVITAEHIDNEVVVTVRPYVAGNITLTKYQDLQGYVVTTKPHNDKNVIITISI